MARSRFTPKATADLRDIGRFIARDNRVRAITFIEGLRRTCRQLAEWPRTGRPRDEVQPGLRSHAYGRYVIFDRVEMDGIEVIRIMHGSRDLEFHVREVEE